MRIFGTETAGVMGRLAVVAICALLLAKSVGIYLGSAVGSGAVAAEASPRTSVPRQQDAERNVARVVERNIFCSTCRPAPVASDDDQPRTDEPLTGIDHLRLIVTLVSEGEVQSGGVGGGSKKTNDSFAAIHDTSREATGLYPVGAHIDSPAGKLAVVAVEDGRVTLERDGRTGVLDLEAREAPRDTPRVAFRPQPRGVMADLASGIRKVGEGRYEIQRAALDKALKRTHRLARDVRIVPRVKGGKPAGFTLYRVRPGSLFSQLGFFNGDAIQAVNGKPMLTPEVALSFWTKLKNASHLTISFDRRGKTLTHDYTIR
jgi:type II secretory pathway component PulC